jgi:hypothetical protein
MSDPFFIGLVMTAMNDYVASQTSAGITVTADEAKLFARNCTIVVRAILDTGVDLTPGGEPS